MKGMSVILEAATGGTSFECPSVCLFGTCVFVALRTPHVVDKKPRTTQVMKAALRVIWVVAGLSREVECLKRVWKSIRENNGIKTLLSLIEMREPAAHADSLRAIACKCLLGTIQHNHIIARVQTKKLRIFSHNIMKDSRVNPRFVRYSKLHISSRLSDLVREPILPDHTEDHKTFRFFSIKLINKITERMYKLRTGNRHEDAKANKANTTILNNSGVVGGLRRTQRRR